MMINTIILKLYASISSNQSCSSSLPDDCPLFFVFIKVLSFIFALGLSITPDCASLAASS